MRERTEGQFDDRLEAYLDDLLDQQDRAAFERLVQERPELRRTVAQQDAIDASIRRVCAPPSEDALRAVANRALQAKAGRFEVSPSPSAIFVCTQPPRQPCAPGCGFELRLEPSATPFLRDTR